jgi:hypothetical protein
LGILTRKLAQKYTDARMRDVVSVGREFVFDTESERVI